MLKHKVYKSLQTLPYFNFCKLKETGDLRWLIHEFDGENDDFTLEHDETAELNEIAGKFIYEMPNSNLQNLVNLSALYTLYLSDSLQCMFNNNTAKRQSMLNRFNDYLIALHKEYQTIIINGREIDTIEYFKELKTTYINENNYEYFLRLLPYIFDYNVISVKTKTENVNFDEVIVRIQNAVGYKIDGKTVSTKEIMVLIDELERKNEQLKHNQ